MMNPVMRLLAAGAPPVSTGATFAASTTATAAAGTTAIVGTTPAGATASTWLVWAIFQDSPTTDTFATPSGWTLADTNAPAAYGQVVVFVRQHDGSSGSYTCTKTGTSIGTSVAVLSYDNCTGYDVAGHSNNFTATPIAPTITTTVDNTRLVAIWHCPTADGGATAPTGYTSRVAAVLGSESYRISDKDALQATGATGTGSAAANYGGARSWTSCHLALKP